MLDLRALLAGLTALGLVATSCAAPEKKPKPEQLEGGRKTSPARRSSDERPKPWVDDKRAHDSDRTGIEAYRVRKQWEEQQRRKRRDAGPK